MGITLSAGTARHITGLLMMLAELPSTPDLIAEGARRHLSVIDAELPGPHHPQPWDQQRTRVAVIDLDTDTATAVAELLEMLDEIGSTPPSVAADARRQAEDIRSRLAHAGG
jgi:hypothetical protein